jgi:magnesium transporter
VENLEILALQEKIQLLLDEKDMKNLKLVLQDMEEVEILYIMNALNRKETTLVFRLLGKDVALSIFEDLDLALQIELFEGFTDEYAREVIEELDPDDRVNLLEELPASVAKRLIAFLAPEDRKVTNILMGYESETAGRIMTPEFITLRPQMTAADALAKIRVQAKDKETIYTLFVTDEGKKLLGVLSLKKLIVAEPSELVGDIMGDVHIKAFTDTDREEAAKMLKTFDLLALPVVDKEDRIVGIITIDDALDILEEEATEDIFDQAGFADITGNETSRSEVLVHGSIWAVWKVRLPFLLISIGAGLLSALVMGGFEDVLHQITMVAFFIPLIMDIGGSVGTQSTTLFVRGIALGHINTKRFLKHLGRETLIGFSIGVIVGTIAGIIAGVWGGVSADIPLLGFAVGLALVVTTTIASVVGFSVPYILLRLKLDQAAGSSPIITAIKDVTGLLTYFLMVSLFLRAIIY